MTTDKNQKFNLAKNTIQVRNPLRPGILAGALQDTIHYEQNITRVGRSIRTKKILDKKEL